MQLKGIVIKDIEPVSMEGGNFETISPEDFWREKPLDQLAAEQGVAPVHHFEDVWGKAADLWADEDDFAAFLAATKTSRAEEHGE